MEYGNQTLLYVVYDSKMNIKLETLVPLYSDGREIEVVEQV